MVAFGDMGETLPQVAAPGPIAKALGEQLPEAKFKPSIDMIDFTEERIRSSGMKKLRSVAKKAGIPIAKVQAWFQDPAFIDWYGERMERADQYWADEVWHAFRARALKGKDTKAMEHFLKYRDKRLIKRQQAAAQAQTVVATHISVALVPPKDPEVREREVEIREAHIV